jgi:hypothetical protein
MRFAGLVALFASACGTAPELPVMRPTVLAPPLVERVLLVTWDGVRWQDVLGPDGRTNAPSLWQLIDRGVALGADGVGLRASGPNFVSLPGYREILTGRAVAHCRSNDCGRLTDPTLFDELHATGIEASELAVVASWETICDAAAIDARALSISAGRHAGPGRGHLADEPVLSHILDDTAEHDAWPGHFDYRRDEDTVRLALAVEASLRPRLFHVSLGDTDEHAHRGDRPGYLAALAAADAALGRLIDGADLSRTVVIVTTDHGRAANFRDHGSLYGSSAAVWLVAAGASVPRRGMIRSSAEHHLRDIAPTLRVYLGLPEDTSPRAGTPISALLPAPLLWSRAR